MGASLPLESVSGFGFGRDVDVGFPPPLILVRMASSSFFLARVEAESLPFVPPVFGPLASGVAGVTDPGVRGIVKPGVLVPGFVSGDLVREGLLGKTNRVGFERVGVVTAGLFGAWGLFGAFAFGGEVVLGGVGLLGVGFGGLAFGGAAFGALGLGGVALGALVVGLDCLPFLSLACTTSAVKKVHDTTDSRSARKTRCTG